MDLAEFDRLVGPLRQQSAKSLAAHGFSLVEGLTATAAEIADAEQLLGAALPDKYKEFMIRYGGGMFGFVELFPITAKASGGINDLFSVNRHEFPDGSFVAVAPVGTGDHWGFLVADGRCHDEVWFHFHDDDDRERVAADFLEFVIQHGVNAA